MLERHVLFFGDSHTLGVGDPQALGWVGRVCARAAAEGVPLRACNLGVGGQTSVEVVSRWRAEAAPRLPAPGDGEARVVFAFGVNDATLEDESRRCSREQSLGALDAALAAAEELGIRPFVVGPAPVEEEEDNERIAELSGAFGELCAERAVPYVEPLAELRGSPSWRGEVAAGDGAHPGAAGYVELAEIVLAAGWLEWLRS
jgi:lysophospholipase L1-like esterase